MFSALSYYIYLNYSEGRSQSGSHFELLSESPQTLSGTNSVFFFFSFAVLTYTSSPRSEKMAVDSVVNKVHCCAETT